MSSLFSLFDNLGLLGGLISLVLTIVFNSIAMWFVINHMMDHPGGAPFYKCAIVTVLLPVVLVLGAVAARFIPIPILNIFVFFFVVAGGSRAVVEGIFEMPDGYFTVIILYWLASLGLGVLVNMAMPNNGTRKPTGFFESAGAFQEEDEFGGYMTEMQEMEAEFIEEMEMQQRINEARFKVTLVEIEDDAVRVLDVFRSEKLEQVDLPRMRKESGFGMEDYIVLGVFINTVKELTIADVDEGKITFAYPTTSSITFDPLDEWPAPGNFYRGTQAYKIFRANEDGSLYEGGGEESTTENSSPSAEESDDLLAAVSDGDEIVDYYYYIFFNMKNPDDLSDCHLVFEPVSRTFEIRSMGDVLAEMSN